MKNNIINWFHEYTSSYFQHDDHSPYYLKYIHSIKVSENARNIALEIGLTPQEADIAEIIGILHDCGRFDQFAKFNTFNDNISLDHAEHSVHILEENHIFERIDRSTREIIIKSIRYHNKKDIPLEKLTEKETIFAKIIRDADKVDIYRVMVEQLKNPEIDKKTLFLNQSEEIAYSAPILDAVKHHKLANLQDMRTVVDFRLIQLSWVFDINFLVTYKLLKSQGYFSYLLRSMPGKNQIEHELEEINQHINQLG